MATYTTMLDPHGNEVLVDDPIVPPPTDADEPFDVDADRLEELLELSLHALQWYARPGSLRHE